MTKVIRYIHRPNLTELGMGNTHDKYMVGQDQELSTIFSEGVSVDLKDIYTGKTYSLYSKRENNEYRVKRMGDIYDDYHMDPGDEIEITVIDNNSEKEYFLKVNECCRVFLNPVKSSNNKIIKFEIINEDRLPGFTKDETFESSYSLMGKDHKVEIKYIGKEQKRKDSPILTDIYEVKYDNEFLQNLKNGYYYLTIKGRDSILKSLPKSEFNIFMDNNLVKNSFDNTKPLQQIFYGAPGTGKSHEITKQAKGEAVIRTTFHPDSDYSTFVGAYKPIMGKGKVYGAQGPLTENGKPIEESKITYQYVKQVFLKAYLGAWKKYTEGCSIGSSSAIHEFDTDNGRYVINSVGDYDLILSREFKFPKTLVSKEWPNLWNNGVFGLPIGPQTGKSVQHAIANWIVNKLEACSEKSFEDGWEKLVSTVKEKGRVVVQKTQTYIISGVADDKETLTINVEAQGKKRATLKNKFESSDNIKVSKLERTLIDILKGCSSDFDEAWDNLKLKVDEGKSPEVNDDSDGQIKPQFLIIEEINRGNCAQIFGDIFQLLDRADNGFSVYPIEADSDIRDAIDIAFSEEEEFMLTNAIDVEDSVENYTSNFDSTLSDDIRKGRILLLPPNLYIWATMNTSDQSLFPIDSAFKRRWEWVYMPIKDHKDKDYKIEIDDTTYDWWGFLEKINSVINTVTNSEDKKLGYFFVKTDKKIDAKKFVGKVLFYLWNDVFKNYGFDNPIFNKEDKNKYVFSDFFQKDGSPETDNIKRFLKNLDETIDKENSFTEKKPEEATSTTGNNNPDLFANQE